MLARVESGCIKGKGGPTEWLASSSITSREGRVIRYTITNDHVSKLRMREGRTRMPAKLHKDIKELGMISSVKKDMCHN